MPSELSIMNAALAHLGEERQLDDPAPETPCREQRVFQGLLPDLRDAMLRKHPWLCAERRLTVTREPLTVAADWAYANLFLMPTDLLRLWSVESDEPWQLGSHAIRDDAGVVIERRKALFSGSEGPLNVKIVERVDYEHLDPCLAEAMGYELAKRAAGPLQADKALAKWLAGAANEALAMAVTVETSEFRDGETMPLGRFLSSR